MGWEGGRGERIVVWLGCKMKFKKTKMKMKILFSDLHTHRGGREQWL